MKKLALAVGSLFLLAGAGCSTSSSLRGGIETDAFSLNYPSGITMTQTEFNNGYRLYNYDDSVDPGLYPDNAFYVDFEQESAQSFTMDDFTAVYPNVYEASLGVGDRDVTLASDYDSGDDIFTREDAYFDESTGTLITIHYFTTIGLQTAETLLAGINWK